MEDLKKTIKRKCKENWKSKVQDKSSYKNYNKEIKDLKLRFITGRSQRQVPIFQWQGIGPARTGRSAAPAPQTPLEELRYCTLPDLLAGFYGFHL